MFPYVCPWIKCVSKRWFFYVSVMLPVINMNKIIINSNSNRITKKSSHGERWCHKNLGLCVSVCMYKLSIIIFCKGLDVIRLPWTFELVNLVHGMARIIHENIILLHYYSSFTFITIIGDMCECVWFDMRSVSYFCTLSAAKGKRIHGKRST